MLTRRALICSSHTISGVMPGSVPAARHSFRSRVKAASAAGYSGMCLHYRDHAEQLAQGHSSSAMRGLLAEAGISQIELEFLSDWFLSGDPTAAANEAMFWRAAKGLGAASVNLGGDFLNRQIPWAQMRRRFTEVCQRGADLGVKVALELVPWSNIATLDAAMDLVDLAPNAGLVVDCWHIFRGGIPLDAIAALPGERIICVQINDAAPRGDLPLAQETQARLPCGEGVFDLVGFLAAIEQTGTKSAISVEIISPTFAALDLTEAARLSIRGAQDLLGQRC